MGIYTRDNINYQSMIANMLANRQRGAEIRANAMRNQGKIWGDAISGIGNTFSNALIQYGQQSDAAKQQELENKWREQQFDFQNRQLAQQKELQMQQLNLSRELQAAQQAKEVESRQEEYIKNWNIANEELKAAQAKLNADPTNPELIAFANKAKFNADFWGKKAGIPDMMQPAAQEQPAAQAQQQPQPVVTQADVLKEAQALLNTGVWDDATKAKALEKANEIIDPGERATYEAQIQKMGKTTEQKKQANAEYTAKLNADMAFSDKSYSKAKNKISELEAKYPSYKFRMVKGSDGNYTIVKEKK